MIITSIIYLWIVYIQEWCDFFQMPRQRSTGRCKHSFEAVGWERAHSQPSRRILCEHHHYITKQSKTLWVNLHDPFSYCWCSCSCSCSGFYLGITRQYTGTRQDCLVMLRGLPFWSNLLNDGVNGLAYLPRTTLVGRIDGHFDVKVGKEILGDDVRVVG